MNPAPPVTKYFIDFNFVHHSLKGCQYHNLKKKIQKSSAIKEMGNSIKYYD
jgi:hypothetical protein